MALGSCLLSCGRAEISDHERTRSGYIQHHGRDQDLVSGALSSLCLVRKLIGFVGWRVRDRCSYSRAGYQRGLGCNRRDYLLPF